MYFHDEERPFPYRLSEVGFLLMALALGLLCLAELSSLASMLGAHETVQKLRQLKAWDWCVDAPIPWLSLLGALVLFNVKGEGRWGRLAGLLVVMNGFDAAMWTISRGGQMGLPTQVLADRFEWVFLLTTVFLGYFELMITAILAANVAGRVDKPWLEGTATRTRVMGILGLVVWTFLALTQTAWDVWPPMAWLGPDFPLLWLLTLAIVSLMAFQVTAVCLATARVCRQERMRLGAWETGHELLRSRSETEGDDILFK